MRGRVSYDTTPGPRNAMVRREHKTVYATPLQAPAGYTALAKRPAFPTAHMNGHMVSCSRLTTLCCTTEICY